MASGDKYTTGPVKVVWIRITEVQLPSDTKPVKRLFFRTDANQPYDKGYFELYGHVYWAQLLVDKFANEVDVTYDLDMSFAATTITFGFQESHDGMPTIELPAAHRPTLNVQV